MRRSLLAIALLVVAAVTADGASREGVLEGSFEPPDAKVRIDARKDGATVATAQSGGRPGSFRLTLEEGVYTIVVTSPVSSFPVRLEGVNVQAGETTTLPSVLIMPGSGKAVLEGMVAPPRPDSAVRLYAEGRERAAVRPGPDGRYEFTELPSGSYEVRASAPGHAPDVVPVAVPENQRVRHTAVLLPLASTDGVDWTTGNVRATGVGRPPKEPVNPAALRAMTQRAAVADAQRNLLRTVQQIRIDGGRTVGTLMQSRSGARRIEGFLKGFAIVSERVLDDGSMEVVLELPLTGSAGLSRFIPE